MKAARVASEPRNFEGKEGIMGNLVEADLWPQREREGSVEYKAQLGPRASSPCGFRFSLKTSSAA